ncbi:MAG: helix-turn-helix domain-containing protein [Burkholderiales bacterium]|nr:helix-turn-helix domain-containing protein [Burkholderiales bacterium]
MIDVAEQCDVTEYTVIYWERGSTKTIPAGRWPKLVKFLGYNPEPEPDELKAKLRWKRRLLGLTASGLGKLHGVSVATIQSWERGETSPTIGTHRGAVAGFLASLFVVDFVQSLAL